MTSLGRNAGIAGVGTLAVLAIAAYFLFKKQDNSLSSKSEIGSVLPAPIAVYQPPLTLEPIELMPIPEPTHTWTYWKWRAIIGATAVASAVGGYLYRRGVTRAAGLQFNQQDYVPIPDPVPSPRLMQAHTDAVQTLLSGYREAFHGYQFLNEEAATALLPGPNYAPAYAETAITRANNLARLAMEYKHTLITDFGVEPAL